MAIDLLSRRAVEPEPLLSDTFALDQAKDAFKMLTDPQEQAVKVVLLS